MLDDFNLANKVALVTGGSRGIGKAVAKKMLQAKATIFITGRNEKTINKSAKDLREETGGEVFPFVCDVTVNEELIRLRSEILERFGRLDILVNNAGVVYDKLFLDTRDEEIDDMIKTNLIGVMKTSKILGKIMVNQKRGKIINIGSYDGLVGTPRLAVYGTTKGGVIQFTRMLAVEWARHNINVNVICPGYIRTSMNDEVFKDEELTKKILKRIPLRRVAEPEELGPLVVYLSSKASDYMTGQVLTIDGGETAQ